jgi:hypothetical protein
MAGKTFPGIGDLKDESPPLDPADAADSAGSQAYSGPTVVDDAKVEQGLQKLRSLDAPPGPLTGIHQAVTDALEDPGRAAPRIPIDLQPTGPISVAPNRGTAVGRSVSEPVSSQQNTPVFDDRHLRGTMFGHSVHLPDIELAIEAKKQEEISKALAVVDRGQPTSHEVAIFEPAPYPRHATPLGKTPYPQAKRFRSTPYDLRTTIGRKKVLTRFGLAAVALALVAGAALLWLRANGDDPDSSPRPAPAAAAPAARPVEAAPVAPPAPPAPATADSPAVAPAPAATTAPKAVPPTGPHAASHTADEAETAGPARSQPEALAPAPVRHTHPTTRAERRHPASKAEDGQAGSADEAPAPAKTTRKRPVEEDPDATMAPTIE